MQYNYAFDAGKMKNALIRVSRQQRVNYQRDQVNLICERLNLECKSCGKYSHVKRVANAAAKKSEELSPKLVILL